MFWQNIHHIDQQITLLLNSWNSGISDHIWLIFTNIPIWIPMYILIIALVMMRLGWKKGLIVVTAAVLTFAFCDQFSNLVKEATERLRPCNDPFMLHNGLHVLEGGGKYGFFSAHAANAFGLATSTVIGLRLDKRLKYRGYATWMYFWATMVALSRIFVGKHYLGDVIVGICVGLTAGWAFGSLAKIVIKKIMV